MCVVFFPSLLCWKQMLLVSHEIVLFIVSVKILYHQIHPQPLFGKYSTLSSPCPDAAFVPFGCTLPVFVPWLWHSYGFTQAVFACSGFNHCLSDPSHSEVKATAISVWSFPVAEAPSWEQSGQYLPLGKPVGVIWSVRPLSKEPSD